MAKTQTKATKTRATSTTAKSAKKPREIKVVGDAPAAEAPAAKTKPATEKKVSALTAAHALLAKYRMPMATKEIIERLDKEGIWRSPAGKTPHATLYVAIMREIKTKGTESRFTQDSPGHFLAR